MKLIRKLYKYTIIIKRKKISYYMMHISIFKIFIVKIEIYNNKYISNRNKSKYYTVFMNKKKKLKNIVLLICAGIN